MANSANETAAAGRRGSRWFRWWTRAVIRYRVLVLCLVLIGSGLLGVNLKDLDFDTSNEGFLHPDDPALLVYNEFRDLFGRDDFLVLAVHSESIFSRDVLTRLEALHDDLRDNVPYLADITSLINVRDTRGDGDTLIVADLLGSVPETDEDLARLRERVLADPLYVDYLISANGSYTAILLQSDVYLELDDDELLAGFDEPVQAPGESREQELYLGDTENDRFVEAVLAVVERHRSESMRIYAAGPPLNLHAIKYYMQRDAVVFMALALLVIGACLYLMFRRLSGVALPLALVGLSLVSTVGLMALLGVSFKLPTTMLPSFVLTVGVGASIHVLSLTFQNLRRGLDRNQAIVAAYGHSGLALVMTSVTTSAGLASFALAKVAPIADLGIFSAIGVLIALLYTFTFLPAMLALLPLARRAGNGTPRSTWIDRLLDGLARFAISRYRIVLAAAGMIVLCGAVGVTQVLFSHDGLEWLPEELGIGRATRLLDRELKGTVVLEVVLDTGRENGLYDRPTLTDIDRLMEELLGAYENSPVPVGKVVSITTLLKEINQALNGGDPAFFRIPEDDTVIPQQFLLFADSGSDDIGTMADSRFQVARVTLKVPWQDALLYMPFIADVRDRFEAVFGGRRLAGGEPMTVTTTGIMSLFSRIISAAMYSAAQSYAIALVVITVLMVALIGNIRLGLLSMIPNLAPIVTVLGLMGWLGIRLDMFTMLIASIVIGLAVDDTIHFMYNFKHYYRDTGDLETAVRNTLATAGRALLTTSVVLSIGFFIFVFAAMNNLFYFGLLAGTAVLLALAADLLLAPALLSLIISRRQGWMD